jgi:hypothetical protein
MMKKINLALFTIGIVLTSAVITQAQKINKVAYAETDTSGYFTFGEKTPKLLLNEISIKAVRHFNVSFNTPLHVKWDRIPGGVSVHFISDGIKKLVAYTGKGTWIHTLSFYDEHKLPQYVKHLVKSVYYDFAINQVVQIEEDDELVYMIQLEDSMSFKTVAVDDYEMKIVKDLRKAK